MKTTKTTSVLTAGTLTAREIKTVVIEAFAKETGERIGYLHYRRPARENMAKSLEAAYAEALAQFPEAELKQGEHLAMPSSTVYRESEWADAAPAQPATPEAAPKSKKAEKLPAVKWLGKGSYKVIGTGGTWELHKVGDKWLAHNEANSTNSLEFKGYYEATEELKQVSMETAVA